jgi:hypothetical protein
VHHPYYSDWPFWLGLLAAIVAIAFLLRFWLSGTWLWFRGWQLGRSKSQADLQNVSLALDNGLAGPKRRYENRSNAHIERWLRTKHHRLANAYSDLQKKLVVTEERQKELEEQIADPGRVISERPRVKDAPYYTFAVLLAFSDIAFTFLCLQALMLPIIFLLPAAFLFGIAGFFIGDMLGKNIDPQAQSSRQRTSMEKRRTTVYLLSAAAVLYCTVLGTLRFLYTQHAGNGTVAINLVASYGVIVFIVVCSAILGWAHEGETLEERLAKVKQRKARFAIRAERCNKSGQKETEAFHAHLQKLDSASAILRTRYRQGFDSAWNGKPPYGVESASSPLLLEEKLLQKIAWPPVGDAVAPPVRRERVDVDLAKYVDPNPIQAAAQQPQVTQPVPQSTPPPSPQPRTPASSPKPSFLEGPPPPSFPT